MLKAVVSTLHVSQHSIPLLCVFISYSPGQGVLRMHPPAEDLEQPAPRGTQNQTKHAFSSEMTQALSVASRLLLSKVQRYLPHEVGVSSLEAGV